LLIVANVKNWQVQLTVAMGRAADNEQLLIQPHQMLELISTSQFETMLRRCGGV